MHVNPSEPWHQFIARERNISLTQKYERELREGTRQVDIDLQNYRHSILAAAYAVLHHSIGAAQAVSRS